MHTVQRSILQQVLTKHIGGNDKIHFSKRLTSYEYDDSTAGPITLHFKDGTTATCDLVIGSDGVRSAVRRTMFTDLANQAENRGQADEAARLREMVEPVYSGQIAHRGLAPSSALSENAFRETRSPQLVSLSDFSIRSRADQLLLLQLMGKNGVRASTVCMTLRIMVDGICCRISLSTLSQAESPSTFLLSGILPATARCSMARGWSLSPERMS